MDRRIWLLFALIAAVALLAGCTTIVKQSGEEPPAVTPDAPEEPAAPIEPVAPVEPPVDEEPPVVDPPAVTPPEVVAPVEPVVELPDYTIIVKNLAFDPKTLTIKVGDTVQWKNERDVKTSPKPGMLILTRAPSSKGYASFKQKTLYANETYEYTFSEIGKLVYIDAIFVTSGVTGSIDVQP